MFVVVVWVLLFCLLVCVLVLLSLFGPRARGPGRPRCGRAPIQEAVVKVDGEGRPAAVRAVLDAAGARDVPVSAAAPPAGLTPREAEVLVLLARGRTNKEVAAALGVAPKTVGRHAENLYAKLGVRSRAAAALWAAEHGLLGARPAR